MGHLGGGRERGAGPHPVPQATSRTERQRCWRSSARSQLRYSAVRPRVSPMYSCHTRAARPSAYWSGSPSAPIPRDRVRYTLSTIPPPSPTRTRSPHGRGPSAPLRPAPAPPPIPAASAPAPRQSPLAPRPSRPRPGHAPLAAAPPMGAARQRSRRAPSRPRPLARRGQGLPAPHRPPGPAPGSSSRIRAGSGGGHSGENVFIYSPGGVRGAGGGAALAASRSWSPRQGCGRAGSAAL